MQVAGGCQQVPRLPRKVPRRHPRLIQSKRATGASPMPYVPRLPHKVTRNPHHQGSWNYTPALRHTRRVLVIIDLEPVQPVMLARQSDAMQATTCSTLPSLGRLEQYALCTYSFLVNPAQIQILSVDTMLYYISQHINNTWDFYSEPSSMDLRWSDCTGDTFALRNHQILIDLLREHRPHWTEGQEFGIFNAIRDFDNPNQPYIMRLSCHQALPNPNMLP